MEPILDQLRSLAKSRLRYSETAHILAHWIEMSEAASPDRIPAFDPIAVPRLLPFIYLLQDIDGRLRYRVSGEEVNRLFGSNHIGQYLDEVVPAEIYPEVAPFFFKVLDGNVCIFKGHVLLPEREHMEFERVLLPISRNGEVQLLGTLALNGGSDLRTDIAPPERPEPGFHFDTLDLNSGTITSAYKNLAPLAESYRPAATCC